MTVLFPYHQLRIESVEYLNQCVYLRDPLPCLNQGYVGDVETSRLCECPDCHLPLSPKICKCFAYLHSISSS